LSEGIVCVLFLPRDQRRRSCQRRVGHRIPDPQSRSRRNFRTVNRFSPPCQLAPASPLLNACRLTLGSPRSPHSPRENFDRAHLGWAHGTPALLAASDSQSGCSTGETLNLLNPGACCSTSSKVRLPETSISLDEISYWPFGMAGIRSPAPPFT